MLIFYNKNYVFIISELDGNYEKALLDNAYLSLIENNFVIKKIPFKKVKIPKRNKTILNKDIYFFTLPTALNSENKKILLPPIIKKIEQFKPVAENELFQALKDRLIKEKITLFKRIDI